MRKPFTSELDSTDEDIWESHRWVKVLTCLKICPFCTLPWKYQIKPSLFTRASVNKAEFFLLHFNWLQPIREQRKDFVAQSLSVFAFNVDFVSAFLSVDRATKGETRGQNTAWGERNVEHTGVFLKKNNNRRSVLLLWLLIWPLAEDIKTNCAPLPQCESKCVGHSFSCSVHCNVLTICLEE